MFCKKIKLTNLAISIQIGLQTLLKNTKFGLITHAVMFIMIIIVVLF